MPHDPAHRQVRAAPERVAARERERARLELYRLLDEAEADVRAGDRGISTRTVRRRLGRCG